MNADAVAATPQDRAPEPDRGICKCGLAWSYHDGRLRAPDEYDPRYPSVVAARAGWRKATRSEWDAAVANLRKETTDER